MKSTVYGKGDKGKATKLHSQLVRSRGKCESCGSVQNLQTAHIISRRYASTRVDTANAFCLCARCHFRFTDHADEWLDFIASKIGMQKYLELKNRALIGGKVDWAAEVVRLKQLLEEAA